jgi:hypothetical protein
MANESLFPASLGCPPPCEEVVVSKQSLLDMRHFGFPDTWHMKPLVVLNKTPVELPDGHRISREYLCPAIVTIINGVLTVDGVSVALPSAPPGLTYSTSATVGGVLVPSTVNMGATVLQFPAYPVIPPPVVVPTGCEQFQSALVAAGVAVAPLATDEILVNGGACVKTTLALALADINVQSIVPTAYDPVSGEMSFTVTETDGSTHTVSYTVGPFTVPPLKFVLRDSSGAAIVPILYNGATHTWEGQLPPSIVDLCPPLGVLAEPMCPGDEVVVIDLATCAPKKVLLPATIADTFTQAVLDPEVIDGATMLSAMSGVVPAPPIEFALVAASDPALDAYNGSPNPPTPDIVNITMAAGEYLAVTIQARIQLGPNGPDAIMSGVDLTGLPIGTPTTLSANHFVANFATGDNEARVILIPFTAAYSGPISIQLSGARDPGPGTWYSGGAWTVTKSTSPVTLVASQGFIQRITDDPTCTIPPVTLTHTRASALNANLWMASVRHAADPAFPTFGADGVLVTQAGNNNGSCFGTWGVGYSTSVDTLSVLAMSNIPGAGVTCDNNWPFQANILRDAAFVAEFAPAAGGTGPKTLVIPFGNFAIPVSGSLTCPSDARVEAKLTAGTIQIVGGIGAEYEVVTSFAGLTRKVKVKGGEWETLPSFDYILPALYTAPATPSVSYTLTINPLNPAAETSSPVVTIEPGIVLLESTLA